MTSVFKLKQIGPRDYRLFRDIRLRALKESPMAFGRSYEQEAAMNEQEWKAWTQELLFAPGAIFIILEKKRAVAVVLCYLKKESPLIPRLGSVWVDPLYRGQGLGKLLLEAGVLWAKKNGFAEIRLENAKNNLRAEKLYKSMNFSYTGKERQLKKGSRIIVCEMKKIL